MSAAYALPSAKNLTTSTAVDTFVPTDLFWEVLQSDSHDVIFGTRGSGKTMLLRMMSVQHLAAYSETNKEAHRLLIEKRRLGLFVPLGIDWCVAYQSDAPNSLRLFLDGVNLVSADALVETLDFMISSPIFGVTDRAVKERQLCEALSGIWFKTLARKIFSFGMFRQVLLEQQAILRDLWRDHAVAPSVEETDKSNFAFRSSSLATPIEAAIRVANPILGFPKDQRWLYCLDELEGLKPTQLEAITTLLRGTSQLTVKITTQPYTLDSVTTQFSSVASAVDFRDFQVKRLQFDPAEEGYRALVGAILRKRVRTSPRLTGEGLAAKIFGVSTFTKRAELTATYGNDELVPLVAATRATRGGRKTRPVTAIRALRRAAEGNRRSIAYSGWDTLVRCSDGNAGMFVRMLNELQISATTTSVEPETQHQVLTKLAHLWHDWSRALYPDGAVLSSLIEALGSGMSEKLHRRTAEGASVQEEANRIVLDLGEIHPKLKEAFKVGARHSLLVAESLDGSVRYPTGRGVWRLSYALAPRFWLIPRRGRITTLPRQQLSLAFEEEQLRPSIQLSEQASSFESIESSLVAEGLEL